MTNITRIFSTDRLLIRQLLLSDSDLFYKMMSDMQVMAPIPRPVLNRKDSDAKLEELIQAEPNGKKMVWAITEKANSDLIGIGGFLINSDGNPELAYRFRPAFWQKGYGTEVATGLLAYGFKTLNYHTIDADVSSENQRSINILEKIMTKVAVFWNEEDGCVDFRYRAMND